MYTLPAFAWSAQLSLFSYSIVVCWLDSSLLAFFIDDSTLWEPLQFCQQSPIWGSLLAEFMHLAVFLSMRALFAILAYWISSYFLTLSSMRAFLKDPRFLNSQFSSLVAHLSNGGLFFGRWIGFGSTVHFHSYKYSSFSSSSSKR